MDGIVISAMCYELEKVIGCFVRKIHQPNDNDIVILFSGNQKLLMSINPPRLHLTNQPYDNPFKAPMFCMVMRKYLNNSKVINITQPNFERIVNIEFEATDMFGDIKRYVLIFEIMGKHSNIILCNEHVIIDSIKRIPNTISSIRQVLPGLNYKMPQGKLNPFEITQDEFMKQLLVNDKSLSKFLNGISPLISDEIWFRADGDEKLIWKCFEQLRNDLERKYFEINITHGKLNGILIRQFGLCDDIKRFEKASEAITEFFSLRKVNSVNHKDISKLINQNIIRCEKKLLLLNDTLSETNCDELKLNGELITANMYQIKRGMTSIRLYDYHSNTEREIELRTELSPSENAQVYYKEYNKIKRGKIAAANQIEKTEAELVYLQGLAHNITLCSNQTELDEIKNELSEEGFIKKTRVAPKQKSSPLTFQSTDGYKIYVGKNNKQNDELTLRIAKANDVWLHTKSIPGSHVIIKTNNEPIPNTTLNQAAMLAAYYSKASHSANVPVDYTIRKHVKKPSGAKPGMVIYNNFKTIYITPDENEIEAIKL